MKRAKNISTQDWSRLDSRTEAERHAAAMADPDARPMTDVELDRAPRVPQSKTIRCAFGLSKAEFAARYYFPDTALRNQKRG